MKNSTQLIAHRGYSGKYPENTLLAYQAAYAYGARWFECDIQLTKDLQPIVHHDENLLRMTGHDIDIRTIDSASLGSFSAYEPSKFVKQFIGNPLCHLSELARWLEDDPETRLFVEIKQHSIDTFGLAVCLQCVMDAISSVIKQCIIISFNADIVELAKSQYKQSNGWVIPEWSEKIKSLAEQMQPDFLFTNKKLLPDNPDQWWQGKWHWANYNVDDVEELPVWKNKGLHYIETNEIGTLMQTANLQKFSHG